VRLGWLGGLAAGRQCDDLVPVAMGGLAAGRQRARARFNEAEARAPRMGADAGVGRHPHEPASMRPRRVRLGWARLMGLPDTYILPLQ